MVTMSRRAHSFTAHQRFLERPRGLDTLPHLQSMSAYSPALHHVTKEAPSPGDNCEDSTHQPFCLFNLKEGLEPLSHAQRWQLLLQDVPWAATWERQGGPALPRPPSAGARVRNGETTQCLPLYRFIQSFKILNRNDHCFPKNNYLRINYIPNSLALVKSNLKN